MPAVSVHALAVLRSALQAFRAAVADPVAVPRYGVAIMGTSPSGAEGVYGAALGVLAAGPPDARRTVLLDGYRGVRALLSTGAVDVLKVNAAEAMQLAAELGHAPPRSGDADGAFATLDVVSACRALLATLPVTWTAVTDGPRPAVLLCRHQPLVHWVFHLPPGLPGPGVVANPIGAGDTVAGVMLGAVLAGVCMVDAFAWGLAAGTASCVTYVGAQFEEAHAVAVAAGMRVVTAQAVETRE
jgi:fructose-1-phosphate kinase PfkB-like protein